MKKDDYSSNLKRLCNRYIKNLSKMENNISPYCFDNILKKFIKSGIGYTGIGKLILSDELEDLLNKIEYIKSKKMRIIKKIESGKSYS
ncbi:MAG: hypothetical protein QXD48_02140 [Candidatus Aenigmatarchaeota archaeon]